MNKWVLREKLGKKESKEYTVVGRVGMFINSLNKLKMKGLHANEGNTYIITSSPGIIYLHTKGIIGYDYDFIVDGCKISMRHGV